MRRIAEWSRTIFAASALVGTGVAVAGCGDSPKSSTQAAKGSSATAVPSPATKPASEPTRGVATIASELATLCVARIGTPQEGDPASTEIAALVDDLSAAYASGPKNESTAHFMRVALSNMKNGCGPEQASQVQRALDSAGVAAEDPGAEAEPSVDAEPDGKYDLDCNYVLGDFGESGDPSKGFRFIAGGSVRNTGNIGIRVRVTVTWEQLGADPIGSVTSTA